MPKRKINNKKKQKRGRGTSSYSLNRVPRDISSPRLRRLLRYSDISAQINNVGQVYANFLSFVPSWAYSINGSGSQTFSPGYGAWSTLYRYYRVIAFKWRVNFENAESFAVTVWCCPSNSTLASNTSAPQYTSNPRCQKRLLGGNGGMNVASMSGSASVARLAGMPNTMAQDALTGTTAGAQPSQNVFFTVGVLAVTSLSAGVNVTMDLELIVDFYELSMVTS